MKITILHLSDIHLCNSTDAVLARATDIASACFSAARESEACLIAVTGDVAYSGLEPEFELAERLLRSIKQAIQAEGCPFVDIIVVPGNHDCKLKPETWLGR